MGNTCSSVKKSSNESSAKDTKSGERKESAESIPYGQTSSDVTVGIKSSPNVRLSGGGDEPQSSSSTAKNVASSSTVPTTIQTTTTTTTSSSQSKTQLGISMSCSPPPPPSLSPIPTASTPSPYSTPYSTNGGNPSSSAYQNISPTKGHLNLSQFPESTRANSFSQLFHLRADLVKSDEQTTTTEEQQQEPMDCEDCYIIAVSTESDELVVWNVFERKAIRTLRGIPRPRDVRMVDQFRAVVLCNRELMLYDLNQASLVTKLKGVMNQKMPYYGLHEDNYVVALSRNRMYVNMINLKTGDLETTFKAGEDRFLNSLLTSANGKICVCGDETQKPFPLLVWDLSNRKLLYDLRIPHHEFHTRLSAISDDGHYVVSVCQETTTSTSQSSLSPNFLIVYDLQSGTLFKKWKPECDSVSVAISIHSGGCVINGIVNNNVLVWDLSTGNIKYTLSGHTAPPNLLQPAEKANIFLSYNSTRADPELRVWSLDNGTCLWRFKPDKELSCCSLMPNGLTVVYGYVGEKELHFKVRQQPKDSETEEVEIEDNSAEDETTNNSQINELCSRIVPYGNEELIGQIIDLNNKT